MNPIIVDTMNDIINRVDAREWNRVNEHRFRMTDKFKKEKKKVETMKNDWEVATQKIGKENSDLHNEIKRLKQKHRPLPKGWHMVEAKASLKVSRDLMKVSEEKCKLTKEVEKLKFHLKRAEDALDEQMEKNEDCFQKGFDSGREEYEVDKEYLDEKDEEIERLKNEIKAYKSDARNQGQININREKEIRNCMKENEKLKEALMNSSGSFKCEKCNIHLTEDDVYRSVDECEGKLLCESCWED